MYWTDYRVNRIRRANLDGSAVEDLVVTTLDNPYGIALDVAGGKIYWTDAGTEKIQRADLDGSHVEDLVTVGLQSPRGLALDVVGGKMYWTDRTSDKIQRANLDGSGVEDLVTPATSGLADSHRDGLALDVVAGKMYWTDRELGRIQRANLDGSGIEDVTEAGGAPYEVALDGEGKLYWTDLDRGIPARRPGRLRRGVAGGHGHLRSAQHCRGWQRRCDLRGRRLPQRGEAERDSAFQPRRHRWRSARPARHARCPGDSARRCRRQDLLDGPQPRRSQGKSQDPTRETSTAPAWKTF